MNPNRGIRNESSLTRWVIAWLRKVRTGGFSSCVSFDADMDLPSSFDGQTSLEFSDGQAECKGLTNDSETCG